MVEIIKKIVAPGHGKFTKPNPIYFAVHSTANPGATAKNHVDFWSRPSSQGGGQDMAVHFVSDWKEAYQCVDLDNICWQVGNGNRTCIGLEICEATNATDFYKGLEIAKQVILQALKRYGWTVDGNVRSHKWFTENYGGSDGHIDPIPYFARYGWTWNQFLNYLKKDEEDDMTPDTKIKASDGKEYPFGTFVRNDNDKIAKIYTILTDESDPTGRNAKSTSLTKIKWMAKKQEDMQKDIDDLNKKLDKVIAMLEKK